MKKILILYSKSGGGHISLAKSVIQSLNKHYPNKFKIDLHDPLPEFYSQLYEKLNTQWQIIWKLSWNFTNQKYWDKLLNFANDSAFEKKLIKFIKANKPDLVISNNPMIITSLSRIRKTFPNIKTAIHFADPFTPHRIWFSNPNCDLYMLPTKETTKFALLSGLEKDKIITTGWLTRESFNNPRRDIDDVRNIYGLQVNKFTVFIGGAGQGGGKITEICRQIILQDKKDKVQIIANSGVNQKVTKDLVSLLRNHRHKLFLFPYLQNPEHIMNASDLIVGKAGPNFMFEAFTLNKPLFATGSLPGQEEGNLVFIKDNNLGWVETNPKKIAQKILKLTKNKKEIERKKINIERVMKIHKDAHKKTADSIAKLLNQPTFRKINIQASPHHQH